MQLRESTDIKRLLSALGETPDDALPDDLTLLDEQSLILSPPLADLSDLDIGGMSLSLFVALTAGWAAIKGYERNGRSVGWGLTWAALGWLVPVPTLVVTAVKSG